MALHTISEAVKLTGKSRKTIYNYMGSGRLAYSIAANGQRQIDTSELIRVFGDDLKNYTPLHTPEKPQNYTDSELITQLINEVKQLRLENRELAQKQADELAAIRKELSDRPRLEHQVISEVVPEPEASETPTEKPAHAYSDIIKRMKENMADQKK